MVRVKIRNSRLTSKRAVLWLLSSAGPGVIEDRSPANRPLVHSVWRPPPENSPFGPKTPTGRHSECVERTFSGDLREGAVGEVAGEDADLLAGGGEECHAGKGECVYTEGFWLSYIFPFALSSTILFNFFSLYPLFHGHGAKAISPGVE